MGIPWRIYYDNELTYDGNPWDAPALGVLAIVETDPDSGRRLVLDKDYYIWDVENNRWWSVDFVGLIDYLIRPGMKKVLFGRTVPNELFYKVCTFANTDKDFPDRTCWGNKERVLND